MSKGKKYDYRVAEGQTGWIAEITRQVTSKETIVSKSQDGFATEAEAAEWAQREIQIFVKNLAERNKRRSEQRDKGSNYRK